MGLDRTAVVTAALELLDESGLDKLTMRKVAERLGVQLNTVYWHASSKPRLLELMADAMLAGCADTPLPGPWDERALGNEDLFLTKSLCSFGGVAAPPFSSTRRFPPPQDVRSRVGR